LPVASQEKSTAKRSLTFACVARIWGKRKEKCETLTHRLRARRMYMEEFMQRPVDRHTYYVAWKSMAPRKTSVAAAKPIIDRPLTRTIMEMYCPLNGQKLLQSEPTKRWSTSSGASGQTRLIRPQRTKHRLGRNAEQPRTEKAIRITP
jgi:hypothetical protein